MRFTCLLDFCSAHHGTLSDPGSFVRWNRRVQLPGALQLAWRAPRCSTLRGVLAWQEATWGETLSVAGKGDMDLLKMLFLIFFFSCDSIGPRCFFCRELIQWASKVTKGELETAIGQFMHLIKSDRPKPSTCHVVVVFMAAHGRQPHTSEVPAILPSDVRFPEREEELVNLDPLLLVPLDSIKSEKLKVWLTIDACRENQEIVTWTGNQQSQLQRVHRRSETDFHILLACDRGRFANDAYSLADVLIEALDDPWKDPSIIHRSWDLHRWRFQTLRNWHNHHLSLCPSC